MTKTQALSAMLDMIERKVVIYDAVSDPKQRKLLKDQIKTMTWVTGNSPMLPAQRKRLRALEGRFPL